MRPRVQSLSANAARPNIAARRQAPALFLGLSLAGWNVLISLALAAVALAAASRRRESV